MIEQWQELKETIIEMCDNDGTGTQQEVCKFLVNLMDILEKQMSDSENPTGDLISKQAVLNALKEHRSLFCDNTPETFSKLSYAEKSRVDELDTAIATIINLPSVENKGEWIYQEGVTPYKWRCNKCEKMFKTDFNYCPNCGARMKGSE